MNRPSGELKRIARGNLVGHYGIPICVTLIAIVIPFVIQLAFAFVLGTDQTAIQQVIFLIAEILTALISYVLSAGVNFLHLNIARKRPYQISMVLFGFMEHPDRFILTGLLQYAILLVGMVPAIVGIVLAILQTTIPCVVACVLLCAASAVIVVFIMLYTSLALYFALDFPAISVPTCFLRSFSSMKGHKKRLFYIYLSFIGLGLLCVLTLGIGNLWVNPYRCQTLVNFYLDATGQPIDIHKAPNPNPQNNQNNGRFDWYV
ncbi:MAG: DUF975 family protein [Clostridiales bacterium]|nr:DUF975 family protein [Clostridiales bacterium]